MQLRLYRTGIAAAISIGCYAPPPAPAGTALITTIELQRVQDGWGTRPDYTVVLRAGGSASYEGRWGVPMVGRYTARIDSAAFRALAEHAVRIGFFVLDDEYTTTMTDLPATKTTITAGSRVKRVGNYGYSGPDELRSFEDAVAEAAARLAWRSDAGSNDR